MNPARLLIAAVIMAGLGGAVWWSNKKTAADAAKPPADTSPKVLALKEENVTQIEFKHREGPPSIIKKNAAGVWQVIAPKTLPADKYAINNVTNLLSSLTSDRMVDDKVNPADLASYGLAPAVVEVDITTNDGKVTKLLIGEENATGSGTYAKVESDPRLFLTATANKGTLDKTYKDLQDRHLLNFEQDKVSRVELTAKNQAIEFGRAGQTDWQILKPRPMRADGTQVQDLVQKLRDGVFDTVSDEEEKKLPAEFASAPQLATVKVTDANGTQTLEVHKLKDDYYGKSNLVPTPQKLSHDLGSGLDKSLDDFRNKKLFDFGFSDPTRIEFKDGGKSAVYEKSGDKWVSAGKTDGLGRYSGADR